VTSGYPSFQIDPGQFVEQEQAFVAHRALEIILDGGRLAASPLDLESVGDRIDPFEKGS